ncbi:MAG TPA: prolipoprotein diacylglyceryl transferase family protein [Gemmatimonadaceae bacterium]|jgi:phosphatidylglycerol:prolipoprotein diacylglycerol transferase|nr:prolipoprotein diacylglyceryl transferase family protein [Gemmatimonadaceae bacterium]
MPLVFADIVHHPVSYKLGPLQFTGFGFAMLMSFVIGQIILQREMERRDQDPQPAGDMIFAAVIGGLLGAKIYYAILMHDMSSLTSRSGFVFWGGLIGGIIAVTAVVVKKRLGIARMSDMAAVALPAAYSIGRTGCWAVGDDYGKPWNGPFAVSFPEGAPPSTVANMQSAFGVHFPPGTPLNEVVSVHPTQLYEVAMGAIMFFIVLRFRKHQHREGWLFGLYCLLAGIERIIVEFFRAKDDRFFGAMTLAQMIGLGFAVFGIAWMAARWKPVPASA